MSTNLYTELAWLPPAPSDFAASCKALATDTAPGPAVRELAGYGLDANQASRLGRAIGRAMTDGRSLAPLQPFRLGLIGNGTLDLLVPVLVAGAAWLGAGVRPGRLRADDAGGVGPRRPDQHVHA